jgi:hypothetical protein
MQRLALACACALAIGCGASSNSGDAVERVEQGQSKPAAQPTSPGPASSASPASPAPPAQLVDPEAVLAYDDKDPLADLEAADALDQMGKVQPLSKEAPPKGGCVVLDPGRRVWPAPGPVAISGLSSGFAVAGYARKAGAPELREQLFLVSVPAEGLPEPIASFDVKPPMSAERTAPPGLTARSDNDVVLAYTDGAGVLRARPMRLGRAGHGASIEIAKGVDTRFAPALTAAQDRTLLAYALGSTPMRTLLVALGSDGRILHQSDLTPAAMGATAPSFVAGATPPSLVMLDARDGASPLLRVDLGADGAAAPAQVVTAVSMVASPPALAAASSASGAYAVYTGIGSAATTAVGLLAIAPIAGSPEALVPGTAYARLQVSAAAAPRAALFVVSAPTTAGKDPPLELRVHAVGLAGAGPGAVIRAAAGARMPAIARDDRGHVGVAFTTPNGAFVSILRCDDH